jgi:phasin family protein
MNVALRTEFSDSPCCFSLLGFLQDRSEGYKMIKGFEDFQKLSKNNMDAAVKSFGEVNKRFQAIATEMTDYSKKAIEDSTAAFERIAGAKTVDQAIEAQTDYARKAYDSYVSEMSKIGEMYADLAKHAYKPVEKAMNQKS